MLSRLIGREVHRLQHQRVDERLLVNSVMDDLTMMHHLLMVAVNFRSDRIRFGDFNSFASNGP